MMSASAHPPGPGRPGEAAELRAALVLFAAQSRSLSADDLDVVRAAFCRPEAASYGGERAVDAWLGDSGATSASSPVVPSVTCLDPELDAAAFVFGALCRARTAPHDAALGVTGLLRRAWAEVDTILDACIWVAGVAAVVASPAFACVPLAADLLCKLVAQAKRNLDAGKKGRHSPELCAAVLAPLPGLTEWPAAQRVELAAALGLSLPAPGLAALQAALVAAAPGGGEGGLLGLGGLLSEWFGTLAPAPTAPVALVAPLSALQFGGAASQWAAPRVAAAAPPAGDPAPAAASAPASTVKAAAPQTSGSRKAKARAAAGAPTAAPEADADAAAAPPPPLSVPTLFAGVPTPRLPPAVAAAESASLLAAYAADQRGRDERDRAKREALADVKRILERGLLGGGGGGRGGAGGDITRIELRVFGSSGNGFGSASADLDVSLALHGSDDAGGGGGGGGGGVSGGGRGVAAEAEGGGGEEGGAGGDDDVPGGGGGDDDDDDDDDARKRSVAAFQRVVNALRRGGRALWGVFPVFRARVPVVKFRHARTDVAVDLVLGNDLAVHNTALLRAYATLDARLPPLVWAVKTWAATHGVRGAEHHNLSSYAWTLLTLAFLQRGGVIPSLQDPALRAAHAGGSAEAAAARAVRLGRWDVSFVDDAAFAARWWAAQRGDAAAAAAASLTVADLLLGFLDFYAHRWDWAGGVVDARGPAAAGDPRGAHAYKAPKPDVLSVRDPFELGHDLGRVLSEERQAAAWRALRVCSARAAAVLAAAAPGDPPQATAALLRGALWDPVEAEPPPARKRGGKAAARGFAAVVRAAAAAEVARGRGGDEE